ncbi:hypothetical protein L6452_07824 [Arctium lappa]|uniref:Uncharacterized protein n=1 Tax=Arctium lappa TaxID=4217 RepID=A0ACB9EL87_ARCLA|nr:hypothetical protein L6452_07824 [Arctium lappa]
MDEAEEDEEKTPRSPFWLQTTTNLTRIQRYRRRLSTIFFNSVVFIIFLLILALLSILFIIPSLIQSSHHIFKKSWDSINLIIVLIALAFGFLARNINNDEKLSLENGFDRSRPELSARAPVVSPASSDHRQWGDFQDQEMNWNIGLRRERTSSSYPDLRELSPPWNHRGAASGDRRFSDDTHLDYYRGLESDRNYLRQQSRLEQEAYGGLLPEQPPEPPCLPPHTVVVKKKMKGMCYNIGGEGSVSPVTGKVLSPENEPAEYGGGRRERRRGDGERRRARSSEPRKILPPMIAPVPESLSPAPVSPLTKGFFTSFYHKKKKRRQKNRSVDDLYSLSHHSPPPAVRFQPPPPPPSVLRNSLPTKKEKQKKIIIVTPAPAPPRRRSEARPSPTTITRVAPFLTDKPRVPLTMTGFNAIDDSSSGGDSPMKNIPPPPPLPPFKMPDWKFAVEGDFVRLHSTLSSRSVSPDGDEAHSPTSDVEASASAVTMTPTLLYPSPDVDIKADSFIARFKAGLKLEKIISLNQNQSIGMSKLGPGPNDC